LLLAGTGPAASELAQRAGALGLDGRVRLAGYVPDVVPILRQTWAVVLPSYSEGVPRVLMEACAAGVPIVASDIPGVRELIEHEQSGLLVPPRQRLPLARALERICADAALRRRLADGAQRVIARDFTAARQARRFAGEYRALARPGVRETQR
jgi:glycosyltransferase involved in cell wall biosynthesis